MTCIGETIQRTELEMQKSANELYNKTRIYKEKEIWLTAYSLLKSVMNIVSMLRKMCVQGSRRLCALCGMYVWGMMLLCNRR